MASIHSASFLICLQWYTAALRESLMVCAPRNSFIYLLCTGFHKLHVNSKRNVEIQKGVEIMSISIALKFIYHDFLDKNNENNLYLGLIIGFLFVQRMSYKYELYAIFKSTKTHILKSIHSYINPLFNSIIIHCILLIPEFRFISKMGTVCCRPAFR